VPGTRVVVRGVQVQAEAAHLEQECLGLERAPTRPSTRMRSAYAVALAACISTRRPREHHRLEPAWDWMLRS